MPNYSVVLPHEHIRHCTDHRTLHADAVQWRQEQARQPQVAAYQAECNGRNQINPLCSKRLLSCARLDLEAGN